MTPAHIIDNILSATSPSSLFGRGQIDKDYRALARAIHPDVIGDVPYGTKAMTRLSELRDLAHTQNKDNTWGRLILEEPTYQDDAGPVYKRGERLYFAGDKDALDISAKNHQRLFGLHDAAAKNFQRYLVPFYTPEKVLVGTTEQPVYATAVHPTAVGLSNPRIRKTFPDGMPQKHVAWVVSRMLEIAAWFEQIGMVHGGLVPDALYLDTMTHGLQITSFYHMSQMGRRLSTISGKYQHWYPGSAIRDKIANTAIDLALLKRTACVLLGDPSGNGTKLHMKKNLDRPFIEFLLRTDTEAVSAYKYYIKVVRELHGKPKFHKLEL